MAKRSARERLLDIAEAIGKIDRFSVERPSTYSRTMH